MSVSKLRDYLDENNVKYVIISHSPSYAAHEIAACAGVPAKELAKTVIVKVDGKMAMAVLPASHKVNLALLKQNIGAQTLELASEDEFKDVFPECAVGAMPPFGNLYGLEVFVAKRLGEDEEIVFNACSHTELIKLAYRDFERLVKPQALTFT